MEIPPCSLAPHHEAQPGPMDSEALPCTTGKVDFTLLGTKAQTNQGRHCLSWSMNTCPGSEYHQQGSTFHQNTLPKELPRTGCTGHSQRAKGDFYEERLESIHSAGKSHTRDEENRSETSSAHLEGVCSIL